MHYYQFNIGDYAKSTKHLTLIEDIAYRRLLDIYYDTEKPLMLNIKQLSRIAGMSEYQEEINNILNDFFIKSENGYTQKKADEEISNYHSKADVARANGRKGGRPKESQLEPKKTQPVNSANPDETGLKTNYKPLTINQEPLTNNQLKDKELSVLKTNETELINCQFELVWKTYPAKANKKKALAAFQSYIKKNKLDAEIFSNELINDINKRCNLQQFGFDKLHFTTYMNGERWNDAYAENLSNAEYQHEQWKQSIAESNYTDEELGVNK